MQIATINEQLTELLELLKIEKKEDFDRFRQQVLQLTLQEKKEKGLTWHPLLVKKEGFTFGDRAFVILEKTTQLDEPHQFRSGTPVELFSTTEDSFSKNNERKLTGVIQFLKRNQMKVVLNAKDIPNWVHFGSLGVDLLFDERTYREMEKAMRKVIKARGDRLTELKAVFYHQLQPRFGELPTVHHDYLNDAQKKAVQHILAAEDVAIIHGPPGTGKTTTIVHAIKLLCETEKNILVTAPSNAAVDLLAERLSEKGLRVVRIGNISRVDESLINLTLDAQLAAHPDSKHIKKVKIQAAEARKKAGKYKRNFRGQQREERKDNYREARELENWAKQLEEKLLGEILYEAQIIACTFVNSVRPILEKIKFRTLVIDEAAQALEPATWIPIAQVHKVILAGDPFQLPPTVKSLEAKKNGLGITLLEKAIAQFSTVSFLNVQYRMNSLIMNFSNAQFYDNQLVAANEVANWALEKGDVQPVIFIDTAGAGFEEEVNEETLSKFNSGEYFILREHFLQFVETLSEHELEMPSIGIIAPYRAQIKHIKDEFLTDEKCNPYQEYVTINTIDGFQGQERDVIYISLVRSNDKSEIGFLSDYRRMNVAMTRAKKQLIVIGDTSTIGNDKFYGNFIDYVEKLGGYRSAWEFIK
ncbi:MAG TPA: AAA family ATPase [Phaeodactylibacter sp.]|nr:AAA family ATPase [Phaeodactylibacter sp.]